MAEDITLTDDDKKIVHLIAQGKYDKEIAYELGLSYGAISMRIKRLKKKLGAHGKKELAQKAFERKLA